MPGGALCEERECTEASFFVEGLAEATDEEGTDERIGGRDAEGSCCIAVFKEVGDEL
jgi:hypothetical protein